MGTKEIEVTVLPGGRMDAKNTAKYVGLSPKTLATLRSQGRGPRYLKRGRVFYFVSDVENWLGEAERMSTTQNRPPDANGRFAGACKSRRRAPARAAV